MSAPSTIIEFVHLRSRLVDLRPTRLAWGAATLLSSHAGHPRPATSDTTKGSQARRADSLKESQLAVGRDHPCGVGHHRRAQSEQQASKLQRGCARFSSAPPPLVRGQQWVRGRPRGFRLRATRPFRLEPGREFASAYWAPAFPRSWARAHVFLEIGGKDGGHGKSQSFDAADQVAPKPL